MAGRSRTDHSVVVVSPLPFEECRRRLARQTDGRLIVSIYQARSDCLYRGEVHGRTVRLRRPGYFGRGAPAELEGHLNPHEQGTRFEGAVRSDISGRVAAASVAIAGAPLSALLWLGSGPERMTALIGTVGLILGLGALGLGFFGRQVFWRWLSTRYFRRTLAALLESDRRTTP